METNKETNKQINKQTNLTTNLKNHFIKGSCLDEQKTKKKHKQINTKI